MSPAIIQHWNDPNSAVTLGGIPVHREDKIFLSSYQQWFPVLPQSMHFIFKDTSQPRGSTLFCTCGATGIIVGYEAYKDLNSYIGSEVLACHHFIQYGVHADKSHE